METSAFPQQCLPTPFRSGPVIKLAMLMLKRADHVLTAECAITHAQFHILVLVKHCAPVTQAALANQLDLTQAAVSRLTETLESKQLVRRYADPTNRRANQLEITEAGSQVLEKAIALVHHLEQQLYQAVSPAELSAWLGLTEKLLRLIAPGKTNA